MVFRCFFALALWHLLGCAVHAAEPVARISLHAEVAVGHRQVYLADVATVAAAPALAASLGKISLGRAPQVGYVERIGRGQIEALLLRRAAIVPRGVQWQGAETVSVRTLTQPVAAQALAEAALNAVRQQFRSRASAIKATIAVSPAAVEIPMGDYRIQARSLAGMPLARRLQVWVDLVVDEQVCRSVLVPVAVEARQQVLVAVRPIAAGALAGAADFELRDQDVAGLGEKAIAPARLPGAWRMREAIRSGEVLAERLVPQPGAIMRGDPVRMHMQAGPIAIEADAVALSTAGPGQLVQLQANASRAILSGRVTGAGQVLIESN